MPPMNRFAHPRRWLLAALAGGGSWLGPVGVVPAAPEAPPLVELTDAPPPILPLAAAPALALNPDWDPARWPAVAAEVRGVRIEPAEGGQALRFAVDNPHGVSLRAEHTGDRALTLHLSPARLAADVAPPLAAEGIEHLTLSAEPGGVVAEVTFTAPTSVVVDGNRLRALFGPAGQGLPLPPPGAEGLPVALPGTAQRGHGPEQVALDAALDALSRGELVTALAGLMKLDAATDPGTRWLAWLWQGRLLRRLDLPLLALEPLARVATESDDAAVRTDAATEVLAVVDSVPGVARLVQMHLAPRATDAGLTWPARWAALLLDEARVPDPVEARLVLLAGRLALSEGQRAMAATLFRLAARRGRMLPEAQWLVGLAAGANPKLGPTDPDELAAQAHFEALVGRAETPAELQARAALSLARLAYGRGELSEASAFYDRVAEDHPARAAADLERRWIALRAATDAGSGPGSGLAGRAALLALLVPFDLHRDGLERALLVATLYVGLCHPRRAETIASRVLDELARDRVGERLADERARAEALAEGDAALAAALGARITAYRGRQEAALPHTPVGRARHEWLRVRISADAVLSATLERRRQARFAEKTPNESGGYGWSGARFVPGDAVDPERCAHLELPDPLVPPER